MDMISSLPDEVLCHVLSFLKTKEAALTSVLAKRWRNLFAFVPNLELNDSVFLHHEECKRERDGVLQNFMDFVDRVLALQGDYSQIKKLTLDVGRGVGSDRVNRWIRNVLRRGVSELDLRISLGAGYRLPPEIFVSRTLVKMRVISPSDLDWQNLGVSLPNLKDFFHRVIRVDQFEMLLPACPSLETLDMHIMQWMNSSVTVSSESLKWLVIQSYLGCREFVNLKSISFDTPKVAFFEYTDHVAEDYPKVNFPNLVKARINLRLTEGQINQARAVNVDVESNFFLRFGNVWKLFSGMKNVEELYLSSDTLEVLSLCCESMPVFKNLKSLDITSDKDRGWQAMPVLLRNCPHLHAIVLEGLLHQVTDKCGDACDCITREEKGSSLASCPVKELHIKGFKGTSRELEMINHFLVSFPCLELMRLYPEEKNRTFLKDPETFKLIEKNINFYDKLTSCDVKMVMPSDPLSKQ